MAAGVSSVTRLPSAGQYDGDGEHAGTTPEARRAGARRVSDCLIRPDGEQVGRQPGIKGAGEVQMPSESPARTAASPSAPPRHMRRGESLYPSKAGCGSRVRECLGDRMTPEGNARPGHACQVLAEPGQNAKAPCLRTPGVCPAAGCRNHEYTNQAVARQALPARSRTQCAPNPSGNTWKTYPFAPTLIVL